MEEKSNIEVINSKQIKNLIATAKEYCNEIEKENQTTDVFIKEIQSSLLRLYQFVSSLKKIEDDCEYMGSEVNLSEEFMKLISSKLGDNRYYWHKFNPIQTGEDEVCGDLLDDLAGIYIDLKSALTIWDKATQKAQINATWQLKFEFESHWGDHCINALHAIHYFLKS